MHCILGKVRMLPGLLQHCKVREHGTHQVIIMSGGEPLPALFPPQKPRAVKDL